MSFRRAKDVCGLKHEAQCLLDVQINNCCLFALCNYEMICQVRLQPQLVEKTTKLNFAVSQNLD